MDIQLKKIQKEDFDVLKDFFQENNIPKITTTFHPFPLSEKMARKIAHDQTRDLFFLAMLNQLPIGFSMLRGWEEGYEIPSFGIFIDHREQGKGFGELVTNLTLHEAEKLGVNTVRLSVHADNLPAVKIYSNLGFTEVGRVEKHNITNIIMSKDL